MCPPALRKGVLRDVIGVQQVRALAVPVIPVWVEPRLQRRRLLPLQGLLEVTVLLEKHTLLALQVHRKSLHRRILVVHREAQRSPNCLASGKIDKKADLFNKKNLWFLSG